ncbi:MAG: hypothetical protein WCK90_00275 [archaeon]
MNETARQVRENLEKTAEEFERVKSELERLEKTCRHKYGSVVYDPVHTDAYTIPGDAPGTMGVDRRGPCYVPSKTEKRWKRECTLCGLVEYTTRVREKVEELPDWPNENGRFRR